MYGTGNFPGSSFNIGTNIITATYSGDANYSGAQAPVFTLTSQYLANVTTTASAITTTTGSVTLTTQVSSVPGQTGAPAPTGTIVFSTGGPSNPIPLVNGQAQATLTSLLYGQNFIFTSYSGDSNYYPNTSNALIVTALVPDFSFSTSPATLPEVVIAAPGQSSAPITLNVVGQPGYNNTINFTSSSCSILPLGSQSTCSFTPASVTGSGSTQLTINTTAQAKSSRIRFQTSGGSNLTASIVGVVLVVLFCLCRENGNRRWGLMLRLSALMALASAAISCGVSSGGGEGFGFTPVGTPTGVTYTVVVTATTSQPENGAQLSHSTSIGFTVQ
jgi:hypothetical protein